MAADNEEVLNSSFSEGTSEVIAYPDNASAFLEALNQRFPGKPKKYSKVLQVLWFWYLSPNGGTQLEIAEKIGISDSLVKKYRIQIETVLRQFSFSSVEEARYFEKSVREKVGQLIAIDNGPG